MGSVGPLTATSRLARSSSAHTLPWFVIAALLLFAACTGSDETASSSPSPSPVTSPSPSPSPSPTPTPTPSPSPAPSPLPPLNSIPVYVIDTDYGFIDAQTLPGAICKARVILPNGDDAGGLKNPQVADAKNNLRWDYPTPPTDVGTGIAIVSCTLNGRSGNSWASVDVGS